MNQGRLTRKRSRFCPRKAHRVSDAPPFIFEVDQGALLTSRLAKSKERGLKSPRMLHLKSLPNSLCPTQRKTTAGKLRYLTRLLFAAPMSAGCCEIWTRRKAYKKQEAARLAGPGQGESERLAWACPPSGRFCEGMNGRKEGVARS